MYVDPSMSLTGAAIAIAAAANTAVTIERRLIVFDELLATLECMLAGRKTPYIYQRCRIGVRVPMGIPTNVGMV